MNRPKAVTYEFHAKKSSQHGSTADLLSTIPSDPYLSSSNRIQWLLEEGMSFRDSEVVRKLEVIGGVPVLGDCNVYAEKEPTSLPVGDQFSSLGMKLSPPTAKEDQAGLMRCYLLDRTLQGSQVALSRGAFLQLLKVSTAPPVYLEVFLNNNGTHSSFVTYSPGNRTPKEFCLLVKLPRTMLVNGSFFFRYSFHDNSTTCLASTVNPSDFDHRLSEVFCSNLQDETYCKPQPDPFIFLSLLFEHFSLLMEQERASMDGRVCMQEARSGVKVHSGFRNVGQAKIGEYALVKRDLHLIEASIAILLRTMEFQVELAEFLLAEHKKMAQLQDECPLPRRAVFDMSDFARVDASLSIHRSMAQSRFEQVRVLSQRVQIQLRLAESKMTSYDTLTGLRIARDTRRDSVSMKTISWLTMVFLPATFVATFFSMGFFHFNQDTLRISVAPEWWIYLAVTLPLTAVVLGVWNCWLWWKERNLLGEETRLAWGGSSKEKVDSLV